LDILGLLIAAIHPAASAIIVGTSTAIDFLGVAAGRNNPADANRCNPAG